MDAGDDDDVPDLFGDGDDRDPEEPNDGPDVVPVPGSPTHVAMERAESSNGSESYGGNVHYQPGQAAVSGAAGPSAGANVSSHLAEVWAEAQRQLNARGNQQNGGASGQHPANPNAAVDLFGHEMAFNADGSPVSPPYNGYNSAFLTAHGSTQPLLTSSTNLWVKMTNDIVSQMKPARAIRILVPASLFKRDASHFAQWTMPAQEGSARAYATAALTSAVFAGTHQGMPCGAHAERRRQEMHQQANQQNAQAGGGQGRVEKQRELTEVDRYVYIPEENPEDEWPMWQIGYEEILNEAETDVTFVGVWLWTYDPTFSTSYLMSSVIAANGSLSKASRGGAQAPDMRHKNMATELEKRKRAGMAFSDLDTKFETNVGMQYGRITNMTNYKKILKQHAGISNDGNGRMFVQNFDAHMNIPAGRRPLSGDKEHGYGSFHPAAVEFACNAKRADGLAFGATNLDGTPADIHPKFLDPASYWDNDFFRLPEGACDMWVCPSVDYKTIFDLPLPRKLQNQVIPGDELMYLFLELEREERVRRETRAANAEPTAAEIAQQAAANGQPLDGGVALAEAQAMYQAAQAGEGDEAFDDAASAAEDGPVQMDVVDVDGNGADEPVEEERERITQGDYARFRSKITETDEAQREADSEIRNMLRNFDNMDEKIASSVSSSNTHFSVGSKDGSYKVQTVKMTDRVSSESTNAFDKIVNPWHEREERNIAKRRTKLGVEGVPLSDPRWAEIKKDEVKLQVRFSKIKDDLARYHLRCSLACFHSEHDRHTLPEGFKSMVTALEKLVKNNGNCASMAYRPHGEGMQITGSDRQVFHELQEWLGKIFSTDAHIAGRDRFLMDELYLQSFEMYAETTFVLILCSEAGKGKSIRAKRLMKLLPAGIATDKAASSARAGMNGNMQPSNGCLIIYDEMTKDLTPHEVDERMEYWKQVLTMRKYTIERTCRTTKDDGNDTFVTCEIVTDHSTAYAICTNMGPCFTSGEKEPTAGKVAMVNRTFSLFARQETDKDSPDAEFFKHLQTAEVKARIDDFQLLTCIVAFCKMAMRGCPWLQPDLSMANLYWTQGDTMLNTEYQTPKPSARRTIRRSESCMTQSLLEAAARIFMYKQTAVHFEAGRPVEGTAIAKDFDIGDLWEVIRVASCPSRAVINDCWYKSLSYSIATSPNGVNVMTSLCHKAQLGISNFFRKIPTEAPSHLVGANSSSVEAQALRQYMGGDGADTTELHTLGKQLTDTRRLRCEWRKRASGSNISGSSALDSIKAVLGGSDAATQKKYANALMPNYRQAALYYSPAHVLKWAMGQVVEYKDSPIPAKQGVKFRELPSNGTAQRYDHAWLVIKEIKGENAELNYRTFSKELKNGDIQGDTAVKLFDYHDAGIIDTLMLLESPDAKRLCPEMPSVDPKSSPHWAFMDNTGNAPNKESTNVALRTWTCADGSKKPAHEGDAVDCRLDGDAMHSDKTKIHATLDIITNRGRLPALQPYTSTRITNSAPIRRQKESGIEMNAVAAYEHIAMIMEASINLSKIVGLTGLRETLHRNETLMGLAATTGLGKVAEASDPMTRLLPFCNDLAQINWARDFQDRQYIDAECIKESLEDVNDCIATEELGDKIEEGKLPEQYMPCMGFPMPVVRKPTTENDEQPAVETPTNAVGPAVLQLLSLPVQQNATVDTVEVSSASVYSGYTNDDLFDLVATHLGRKPKVDDIDAYRRTLVGNEYMWEVTGDLNSYTTWQDHLMASMVARGNAAPDGDMGMLSLLDAELMLWPRLVELKAQKEGTVESKYGIDKAWPQSYTAQSKKTATSMMGLVDQVKVKYVEERTGSKAARRVHRKAQIEPNKRQCSDKARGGAGSSGDGLEDARSDD